MIRRKMMSPTTNESPPPVTEAEHKPLHRIQSSLDDETYQKLRNARPGMSEAQVVRYVIMAWLRENKNSS